MKSIAMIAIPTLLLGCGGGEHLRIQAEAHRRSTEAIEAYSVREARPRLAMKFQDGQVVSIEMYDAQPLPRIPEFRPTPHPGWNLASTAAAAILPALGSSLTLWAAGEAFEEVIKHTSGASNTTSTEISTTTDSRDMSVRTQDNDSQSTVVRNSNVGGRDAGDTAITTTEETVAVSEETITNTETTTSETTTSEDNSLDLDYTFRPNPILFPDGESEEP